MKPQSSSTKSFIIFIIIIVIGIGAYFYFAGTPSDSGSSLNQPTSLESADAQQAGSRVLSLLNQINSLKIDTSIFNSVVYKSLVDYTITVPEQNVGRPNPFAPIGK